MKSNKVVLVTGASGGIGSAIAMEVARRNARVIVHYNYGESNAEKLITRLEGSDHLLVKADFTDRKQIENLVSSCLKKYGRIDVLINNAGFYERHTIEDSFPKRFLEYFDYTMAVNLNAPAYLSYLVVKEMIMRKGCRIVNISSRGAFRGESDAWAYSSAKAGLNAYGQSMAKALGPYGVYVYTLAPGFVDTEMSSFYLGLDYEKIINQSPLTRVATPEEIANVAVYCAFDAPSFMTGSIIDINGASYLRT